MRTARSLVSSAFAVATVAMPVAAFAYVVTHPQILQVLFGAARG
jgi:hypothetical protein